MEAPQYISSLEKAIADIQDPMALRYVKKVAAKGASDEAIKQAVEYATSGSMLHNDKPHSLDWAAGGEKREHVLFCYLAAAGHTNKEIAQITGYSETAIGAIAKQPWFRKRFLEIAKEHGGRAVDEFVGGQALASAMTLVEVRDNPLSKGSERIAAANSILDRAFGKPAVYVKQEATLNMQTAPAAKEDVERQLEAVAQELRSRGVGVQIPNARN